MRRRNDSPFEEDDQTKWGPYTPEARAKFLTLLLRAQREIQLTQGDDMQLISHQELVAIQLTWYRDGVFNYKVADIYNEIYEHHIVMSVSTLRNISAKSSSYVKFVPTILKILILFRNV